MGYGGYSVPCRVGNWAEDEYLGVLNTQEHIAKASTGMLTSQQLSTTLNTALSPAALAPAPSDGVVRFGDCIMCVCSTACRSARTHARDSTRPRRPGP